MKLSYADHRADPGAWAAALGVSREAVELTLASEILDLHVDSFIWHRILGYDLTKRHGHGLLGARFYSQVDLPRLREANIGGATWVITTNPSRGARGRAEAFSRNLAELVRVLSSVPEDVAVVRNVAEYRAARAAGKHAAFIGVQGGNALDHDPASLDRITDDLVLRVTLVHLSTSSLGVTSSPLAGGGDGSLTDRGREFVRALNARKIFVDLAHISRKGFFDALDVHDKTQPVLVTHTGVDAVHRHWRNLTDEQIRRVADLGGTIGIMYQSSFLGPSVLRGKLAWIADHLAHVISLVGDDHVSLGSDWDGAIVPPHDMPTCLELPRLVDEMLRRGWSTATIQKILAGNALRTIEALRG
ncbi:MAG: membrane dipeptidase [Polyangiaceae bacterium]|nr:membrane dipeptidase [Polyangiaceae bacterium]